MSDGVDGNSPTAADYEEAIAELRQAEADTHACIAAHHAAMMAFRCRVRAQIIALQSDARHAQSADADHRGAG